MTGAIDLTADERGEVDRLCGATPAGTRVGLEPDAPPDAIRDASLHAIERWRARAASPFSDRRTVEAAEIVSRAYEGIYAAAV